MSYAPLLASALAASLLAVAPPVLAKNDFSCSFKAAGLSLSFGTLDPSNAVDVTKWTTAGTANADEAGHCTVSMTISGDNGLNYNGTRRLRNGSDYIAYSLALPLDLPAPANGGAYSTFRFTGTILGSAYSNASAGSYSDTVILTVSP